MNKIDEDRLNVTIRKFLKAAESGTLPESGKLPATMTLSVPALGLTHVIDHEIDTGA